MNDTTQEAGGDTHDEAYLVAISTLDNVGPATFRWLLSHGSPRRVWRRITSGQLTPGPGARIDRAQIDVWRTQSSNTDPVGLWNRCQRAGIDVVRLGGSGYPDGLADDLDPPVILFRRGRADRVGTARVAIVGTRRATGYGIDVAFALGRDLTSAGVSVVSGLALGIDAAAHRGALAALPSGWRDHADSGDGSSWAGPLAVVGANLELICPRRNRDLAEQVYHSGVIYSEVPPGIRSAPWRFPVRNRLVAAMCDAVVVVESAANGGSMHTVREALDRDRSVLAVPGPVGVDSSAGTNQLIRDGAAPCLDVEDVLDEIRGAHPDLVVATVPGSDPTVPSRAGVTTRARPNGPAAQVLDSIGWRPLTLDSLATSCAMDPRELAVVLAGLESQGWITRDGSWIERLDG